MYEWVAGCSRQYEHSLERLDMHQKRVPLLLLVIAYMAFISLGLPDGLLGVAWPSMRATFDVSVSSLGILLVALSVGYLLSSFNSGQIVARIGIGGLLLTSSVLVTVSLFGIALTSWWWLLAGCTLLLGMGGGAIDAGLNTYAASHFSERHMNWLHAYYSLGATLGPLLLTTVLVNGLPWQMGYLLVGSLLAAMALAFATTRHLWQQPATTTDTDATVESSTTRAIGIGTALRHPLVGISCLTFFIYTGLEVAAGVWAYTLFTEGRGIDIGVAGTWVGIYWGSQTAGRLVFGVVAERLSAHIILRTSLIAVVVGTLLLWLNLLPVLSFLGLALMGFMLAPVFPLLMSQTPARLGEAYAAHAIGFQASAANLGSALVPGLAGVLARAAGIEVIGPFLLVLALAMLLLHEILLRLDQATSPSVAVS